MDLEKLKDIFNDNVISYSKISAAEVADIMKYVPINLQMDRQSFDYYYEINVNQLLGSDIPIDKLNEMKDQGWSFNEDKQFLILFLKNN